MHPISIKGWRVPPLTIDDQQKHIDFSQQLLAEANPGDPPTLYWSQAEQEGLVLGFSQKPALLNPQSLAHKPLPIYHRRAGGTAVMVGPHLLGLDVMLPAGHPLALPDLVESYRWLGETWVAALRELGIQTRAVTPEEAHEQRDRLKLAETRERESILRRACYGSLSPYEVVAAGRKVVGLDMIRRRAGTLLQAGVLLHWDTERLVSLLGHTPQEQAILRDGLYERAVGLDTLAGRAIPAGTLIAAFERVLTDRA
ncbi:MAG: ligase [Ktedonobacteraceae bacterium]